MHSAVLHDGAEQKQRNFAKRAFQQKLYYTTRVESCTNRLLGVSKQRGTEAAFIAAKARPKGCRERCNFISRTHAKGSLLKPFSCPIAIAS